MRVLLEYLAKNIVNHPNQITVTEKKEGGITNLSLETHPDDVGIVIGKKGKTIKAIRSLINLKAVLRRKKVRVYINEDLKHPVSISNSK